MASKLLARFLLGPSGTALTHNRELFLYTPTWTTIFHKVSMDMATVNVTEMVKSSLCYINQSPLASRQNSSFCVT